MTTKPVLSVLFATYLSAISLAQEPASSASPARPTPQSSQLPRSQREQDDVVRITTNLVQVDAVITDKDGKAVINLKPEEVEIYEDGRRRELTHFSYTAGDTPGALPGNKSAPSDKHPSPPITRLRPEDTRRTIAIVVDDLGLSFQSIYFVRRALKKFVDEQMRFGDLVAIVRTSGGIGALQQFTSDKRQLYVAIDHVRWYASGRSGIGAFAPIRPPTPGRFGKDLDEKNKELEELRDDIFSVGTLGAVSYVVRGLRELPGRKSVLLISDGFRITDAEKTSINIRTLRRLEQLIDQASRASVVISTMNGAGIQTLSSLSAEDSMTDNQSGARTPDQVVSLLTSRRGTAFDLQAGLDYLAEKTGGIAIHNTNDLSSGIRRVIDDQGGYYLVGYRPDQSTFDPKTGQRIFHKLTLKVIRPGRFNVRMRNGFYGLTEKDPTISPSPRDQIVNALMSPFNTSGVHLQLTSLFANDPQRGSFLRSTLHVEANDLTFTDDLDDWHKTTFDMVAVTLDADGKVVDEVTRTDTLKVRGGRYQDVLKHGFVYLVAFPVKKPGAYQMRVVLRDHDSERVGSASHFVEVPDLRKDRLALSGITVNAAGAGEFQRIAAAAATNNNPNPGKTGNESIAGNKDEGTQETDPQISAAVRHFRTGMLIRYSFVIYNARLESATHHPQLQVQLRLFRSGQPVFTGKVQPFVLDNPPDITRLSASSTIRLGADLVPGEYVMQVIVSDMLADEKHRVATQWIDFEVVE